MFATVYISEGLSGVLQTTCQVTELARDASRWRSTVRQSGSWSAATASLSPGRSLKAKFHYTDTDTDFFAAKRTRTDPTEFRRKKSVSVSVSV